jgi:hypothetical protein
MSDWNPINTAPKDGSRFRARGKNWGDSDKRHYIDAVWDTDGWSGPGFYSVVDQFHLRYLTDWKPIKLASELRPSDNPASEKCQPL